MIIQILSHGGNLLALDDKGDIFIRSEYDWGWVWEELPTEKEEI